MEGVDAPGKLAEQQMLPGRVAITEDRMQSSHYALF
jgi:hypothetical protein